MKSVVKRYFPVIIAALGVFFAVSVYFIGFRGTENGLFTDIGAVLNGSSEDIVITDTIEDVSFMSVEVPEIKYIGGSQTVGDTAFIREQFQFTYQDGTSINGNETEYVIYLLDVEDKSGKSVMETYAPEDIEEMEYISSPFIYDEVNDVLYFYKSGVFMVHIRVYYDANTYVEYEFSVPVEVG